MKALAKQGRHASKQALLTETEMMGDTRHQEGEKESTHCFLMKGAASQKVNEPGHSRGCLGEKCCVC